MQIHDTKGRGRWIWEQHQPCLTLLGWESWASTPRSCFLARAHVWLLPLRVFTGNGASPGQFSSLSHFFVWNPWIRGMPRLGTLGTPWALAGVRVGALGLIPELGKGRGSLRGSPKSFCSCFVMLCDVPGGAGLVMGLRHRSHLQTLGQGQQPLPKSPGSLWLGG